MYSGDILRQKAVQSPEDYHPDFLVGPMDRDMTLAMVLDWKSSWCYFNNCNNNIYNKDKRPCPDWYEATSRCSPANVKKKKKEFCIPQRCKYN